MKPIIILILILFLFKGIIVGQIKNDTSSSFFDQQIPENHAELFAEGIVSYPFMNHSSVTISKDMNEMYWSKWYDDEGREEVVFSKHENGKWSMPERASFSGIYSDDSPFFAPDGKRLYFLSRRPVKHGSTSKKENIWYVERDDSQGWSEPEPLSHVINSGQLHWQFSIAQNKNVYYSTDEGIKVSKYIKGEYQEPVLISEVMNSKYMGEHPYISPNEDYILFASGKIFNSFGKNDLYIGYKNADGEWCDPINLGKLINGKKGDMCPVISPDENLLFFVKHDDVFNVYWIKADFIKALNPF